MSYELKACPFCGGEAETVHWNIVHCGNDDCASGAAISKRSWNSRPIESSLESRLKIAVEALERTLPHLPDYYGVTSIGGTTIRNPLSEAKEALAKIRS